MRAVLDKGSALGLLHAPFRIGQQSGRLETAGEMKGRVNPVPFSREPWEHVHAGGGKELLKVFLQRVARIPQEGDHDLRTREIRDIGVLHEERVPAHGLEIDTLTDKGA